MKKRRVSSLLWSPVRYHLSQNITLYLKSGHVGENIVTIGLYSKTPEVYTLLGQFCNLIKPKLNTSRMYKYNQK